jgi:prepilin-type N-terminal cleavage/methylation domain-containing protein
MKRRLKKEDGFTLVELMASLALLTLVSMLVVAVLLFGRRSYAIQSETSFRNNEVRDVMSLIVTRLRTDLSQFGEQPVIFDEETNTLIIGDSSHHTFRQTGTTVEHNGNVISTHIESWNVTVDTEKNSVDLELTSTPNQRGQRLELDTKIYLRRGTSE